ncbi:MAG: ubiquitin-like protein Pup [Nitrospiraceae bacterium]
MEKQERRPETRKEPQGKDKDEVKANPKVVETGKKLKEDIDKLVDEIDDVLEKNAEEFVKNYVQKGGE